MVLSIPKDKTQLKNMMNNYQRTLDKDASKHLQVKQSMGTIENEDAYSLENRLDTFEKKLYEIEGILEERMRKVNSLFDANKYLADMNELYINESQKMENKLNSIQNTNDVNKRLVDFYSRDHDFKGTIRKYFK